VSLTGTVSLVGRDGYQIAFGSLMVGVGSKSTADVTLVERPMPPLPTERGAVIDASTRSGDRLRLICDGDLWWGIDAYGFRVGVTPEGITSWTLVAAAPEATS
jgi:hypothetical protein